MQREEAEALAAKREAHKSPGLSHKRWSAVHDSIKGWHVALVDNHAVIIHQASQKVRNMLLRGDLDGAFEAAGELLMSRVRQHLADWDDQSPDPSPSIGDR